MDARAEIDTARMLARGGDVMAAVSRLRAAAESAADPSPFLFEIGNIAKSVGLFEEAYQAFRAVLEHRPQSIEAATNLANTVVALGAYDSAAAILANVKQVAPSHPLVDGSICDLMLAAGRVEDAAACYEDLTARHPTFGPGHANRAEALAKLGRDEEALESLDEAARINPDDGRIVLNRAFSKLALGRLEDGFQDYEARLSPDLPTSPIRRNLKAARWTGETSLDGPLLVVAEQGLGDELRFAALLPALARLVPTLAIECDPRLVDLLSRSIPGATVVGFSRRKDGRRPVFDYRDLPFQPAAWIEAGSLPLMLRAFNPTSLCQPGFLRPDPAQVSGLRQQLSHGDPRSRLVGLVWGSGAADPSRARFYPELGEWRPVLNTPGIRFVDLQYIPSDEDRAILSGFMDGEIANPAGVDKRHDLSAAAALAAALDAVVGVSSSVTALAGAVGTPTLEVVPERIWVPSMQDRQAWLGDIRTVFPDRPGDWPVAMVQAAEHLKRIAEV